MVRYMPYADMDLMMSLSKRRGFMFQSSEIYGGLGSTWDYGPWAWSSNATSKRPGGVL